MACSHPLGDTLSASQRHRVPGGGVGMLARALLLTACVHGLDLTSNAWCFIFTTKCAHLLSKLVTSKALELTISPWEILHCILYCCINCCLTSDLSNDCVS